MDAAFGVLILILVTTDRRKDFADGQRCEHVEVKMQRYDLSCISNRTTNNRNASQSKQPQDSRRSG